MKISGLTIVRNAIKYDYPVTQAITSILPICDEFIVSVGDSEDDTLPLIQSLRDPKIKIKRTTWDMSRGPEVLSYETNRALKECSGDWVFYVQADEVIHEKDLPKLEELMLTHVDNKEVDALRFRYLHFYGTYYRYRIDQGWFQKQDRIIRNNGEIESYGDAFSFRRKDGSSMKTYPTGCLLYHYGWVHSGEVMTDRLFNLQEMGFEGFALKAFDKSKAHDYGDLDRFPIYFGTHPRVVQQRIAGHPLSSQDKKTIDRKYWWFPPKIFQWRYKTPRRVKERIT